MRSRAVITALLLLFAAIVIVGGTHSALHALPMLGVAALLLCGRFVGEERILARHVQPVPRRRRAPARRWALRRPDRVVSLFARSPRTFRGPPAALAAA
jgi:hypothetical protein